MKKTLGFFVCILLVTVFIIAFAESKEVLVEEIKLSESSIVVYLNKSVRIKADILPSNAKNKRVEWESTNTDIAIVNNGNVTGKSAGECDLTCVATDGSDVKSVCHVEVRVPVQSVQINEKNVSLLVGSAKDASEIQLSYSVKPENAFYQTGTWKSSNEKVAVVDETGRVRALQAGNAKISFVSDDPNGIKQAQISVRVTQAVEEIVLNENSLSINEGKTSQLKASVQPQNAANKKLSWLSSDENVATVSANGMVRAIGAGKTIITCLSSDGSNVVASCEVKVLVPFPGEFNSTGIRIGMKRDEVDEDEGKNVKLGKYNALVTWSFDDNDKLYRVQYSIDDNEQFDKFQYYIQVFENLYGRPIEKGAEGLRYSDFKHKESLIMAVSNPKIITWKDKIAPPERSYSFSDIYIWELPDQDVILTNNRDDRFSSKAKVYVYCIDREKRNGSADKRLGMGLYWGSYEQDGNSENGKEAIEWIIVSIKNEKALLLSRFGLDAVPYNNEKEEIGWKDCSLRNWLNNTFYESAFSEDEKSAIISVSVYGNETENDTDKVIAVNNIDVIKYPLGYKMPDESTLALMEPSLYAAQKIEDEKYLKTDKAGRRVGKWWIISDKDVKKKNAYAVDSNGIIISVAVNDKNVFVRPAIWVDLKEVLKEQELIEEIVQEQEKSVFDQVDKSKYVRGSRKFHWGMTKAEVGYILNLEEYEVLEIESRLSFREAERINVEGYDFKIDSPSDYELYFYGDELIGFSFLAPDCRNVNYDKVLMYYSHMRQRFGNYSLNTQEWNGRWKNTSFTDTLCLRSNGLDVDRVKKDRQKAIESYISYIVDPWIVYDDIIWRRDDTDIIMTIEDVTVFNSGYLVEVYLIKNNLV